MRTERAPDTPTGVGHALRLGAAVVLVGLAAGLAAMALALLLHAVQHLAYDYSRDRLTGGASFLRGVAAAPPWRRLAALMAGGVVAGFGWYGVGRWGRPLVSVRAAVAGRDMPVATTTAHVLLQIVTVALGSPLGREVAPREAGALLAQQLGGALRLSAEERRVLAACGAGAGLAAVYNVPLAGALFVIEVLLATTRPAIAIQALATSGVATWVARFGLGNEAQYHMPAWPGGASLLIWACLAGPPLGVAAVAYRTWMARMRTLAPRDGWIMPLCLAAFGLTGLAAMAFPAIPGNGKGAMQLGLVDDLPAQAAISLLLIKLVVTAACLRAGAQGGLLTPGLTVGGLISLLLAVPAQSLGVALAPGACACVGAAAFLGVAMNMPLTAIVLIIEFVPDGSEFLLPLLAAGVGSAAAAAIWRTQGAGPMPGSAHQMTALVATRRVHA